MKGALVHIPKELNVLLCLTRALWRPPGHWRTPVWQERVQFTGWLFVILYIHLIIFVPTFALVWQYPAKIRCVVHDNCLWRLNQGQIVSSGAMCCFSLFQNSKKGNNTMTVQTGLKFAKKNKKTKPNNKQTQRTKKTKRKKTTHARQNIVQSCNILAAFEALLPNTAGAVAWMEASQKWTLGNDKMLCVYVYVIVSTVVS